MAEKDKKDAPKEGEPAKKKGLPAIVLVAAGAMLGGGGVVFLVPPAKVEVPVEKPVLKHIQVQHPDLMEYVFNPRTEAGKAVASFGLYFVYEVREDRETEAFEQIKTNWDRARSHCLVLLSARTLKELQGENAKRILAHELAEELDATLFPGPTDQRVARVVEVLWSRYMTQ